MSDKIREAAEKLTARLAKDWPNGYTHRDHYPRALATVEQVLRETFGDDQEMLATPWPPRDVVQALIRAADHLHEDHDCDADGHEEIRTARNVALNWLTFSAPGQSSTAVCVYPVGRTTCGYTERNHWRADGRPMEHSFTASEEEQ
jgi:hypothetical protein